MKKIRLILLINLLAIAQGIAQSNIHVNEKAPTVVVTDWIANIPSDKSLTGKNIVLEFWATWCGPCIAAVPHLNELQSNFKNDNLYFISMKDESVEKVNRSLKRINFKSIVVSDQTKSTQKAFGDGKNGLEQFPLTVLITKNGNINWIGKPNELTTSLELFCFDYELVNYDSANGNLI